MIKIKLTEEISGSFLFHISEFLSKQQKVTPSWNKA